MRTARNTIRNKLPEYYSDFFIDFNLNPVTGNLARATNEESVKNSIINIILTNLGERPYQFTLGSKIRASLFDPMDSLNIESDIQSSIMDALQHEPRADIAKVDVYKNVTQNGYNVNIFFAIKNIPEVFSVSLFLKRIR